MDKTFERIRRQIAQDLQPVKPLARPWKRGLALVFLWLLIVSIVLPTLGIRNDHETLGLVLVWIVLLQLSCAYLILSTVLRVTIPGQGLPSSALALVSLVAIGVHLGLFVFTFRLSPVYPDPGQEWVSGLACFSFTVVVSLLPLLLWSSMAKQGLPANPWLIGVLSGLGSGLAAEAALRTHCAFSSQNHVLSAHTSGVAIAVCLGLLIGFLWDRRQGTHP